MEDLNINSLCNDKYIKSLYPVTGSSLVASYSYGNTIRSKVINYSKTLIRDNHQPTTCSCSTSTFTDPALGHVVTGNLSIVNNRKLRNLLSKGINYRECLRFTKNDLRESINADI